MDTRTSKRNARRSEARKRAAEQKAEEAKRLEEEEKKRKEEEQQRKAEESKRLEEEAEKKAEDEKREARLKAVKMHKANVKRCILRDLPVPEDPPEITAIKEEARAEWERLRDPKGKMSTYMWTVDQDASNKYSVNVIDITIWQSATNIQEARARIKIKLELTLLLSRFYEDEEFTFGIVDIGAYCNMYAKPYNPEVYEEISEVTPDKVYPFDKGSGMTITLDD